MTAKEKLEFLRGVVVAKMKLHPNDTSFVRFNSIQLMALLDIAESANNAAIKTPQMCNALDRLSET